MDIGDTDLTSEGDVRPINPKESYPIYSRICAMQICGVIRANITTSNTNILAATSNRHLYPQIHFQDTDYLLSLLGLVLLHQ